MRAPWREAIDGQSSVLRALRNPSARDSLVAYFSESPTLKAQARNQRDLRRSCEIAALEMVKALESETREAEPFWLAHDIQEAVLRGSAQVHQDADHPLGAHRFQMTDLPVRTGLVWLAQPLALQIEGEHGTGVAVVRGLFFDRALKDPVEGAIHLRPEKRGAANSMGIVSWIDADRSPMFNDFGLKGLIPYVHPYLSENQTLREYLDIVREQYGDSQYDLAVHQFPVAFMVSLFSLLQQRVLLFGGSGLERAARKVAERDGLKTQVQVLTWRKAQYRYPEGHVPGRIDWSCRWPVTEHVRHYRNPDGSIRKSVVIPSYIKGPDTKPLKSFNTRVHEVKR